jgi:MFS family permease
MRPIGAVILGVYIDRFGRRSGLILTLGLMAIGTLLIACLPGYAVIGVAAPIVILISRLVQGFSAGVELGGVSVYLSEIATPGHKGFYVSWQSASQQVAVMFAGLIGVVLHSLLPPATMEQWGWRVPFWIGCLIIPLLYLLRRSLAETDEFLARKQHPSIRQILHTLASNWAVVLIGLMMVTMTTVSFYLITAYTPTFGQEEFALISVRKPRRHTLRRNFKLHLASDHGRSFRSDRTPTGSNYFYSRHTLDLVPGDVLAGT